MGLDQYGMAVMPHKENSDFGYAWTNSDPEDRVNLIAQWRKHSDLQGYMEALYIRKCQENGVEEVVFNCQPLRLTLQDLNDLEEVVTNDSLPLTSGFFFGKSLPEDKADDLAFINQAREAIGMDMEIYYDSWW